MHCWEGACEDARCLGSTPQALPWTHDAQLWARVCSLVGPLLAAMSMLDELITSRRVLDLNSCRGLCGIPASITRKKDLVEALLLQTRCPHKRRAVIRHLTDNITANALRLWIKGVAGCRVPDSKVMGRGRAEILDAIIRLECPAGEYSSADSGGESSAQGGETHEKAQGQCPAGEYSSVDRTASASQPTGSHDVGTAMVA